jgi:hypothetical protein
MSSQLIIDELSGFAPAAVLIGEGFRADRIWTRDEFLRLCDLNAPHIVGSRGVNPRDTARHFSMAIMSLPLFELARRSCVSSTLHASS